MEKGRLEAFSDGVFAIIITIMVLELKVPHEPTFAALCEQWPVFLSYILSFIYVGIYWNNHHHLFQAVEKINGLVLWANLGLLFTLSLTPFTTEWMGENHFAAVPVAVYGAVLAFNGVAYFILVKALLSAHGQDSLLAQAIGTDFKGRISVVIYLTAIGISYWCPAVACALYGAVAVMWLVPDKRIENKLPATNR